MGARIVAAPVDAGGLQPAGLSEVFERLAREGRRAKFLYTVATCHNPTATTLSLERRREVLRLAERHGALVVDDATYAQIRFGEMPPDFIELAPEHTIHLGSFSKTIAPGLRLGWATASRKVAAALAAVRTDLGTSPLLQRVVARYLSDGFGPHLAGIIAHYRRKREAMLTSLDCHCREVAEWQAPAGGFFVWLTLRNCDERAALDAAEAEKVSFIPGSYFAAEPGTLPRQLRLSFGEVAGDAIDEGLRRLGRALTRVAA
jgi:DNA-binding transcriptional MocR family regulator